jgi:peroxiredoxin
MATTATQVVLDTPAAEFRLPATDGKTYALDDVAGEKGTVVVFICNHCPYVKAVIDRMVSDARVLMSESIGFAAICSNDAASYPEDSFENMKRFAKLMISRFHISTTRPRQSLGRMGRSVRRTSSVTMPTVSSSIAAGSTKAAQLRLARGRPESLSRPCARLRPPVWRRLTKRRLLAARSNGRTNKAKPCQHVSYLRPPRAAAFVAHVRFD